MTRTGGRLATWLVVLALCAAQAAAQDAPLGPDPYTRGEPDALARAGYVRVGSMPWAYGDGTSDIEEVLGPVPVAWIETEHLRLGCALPARDLPRDERETSRAELERLRERLPGVEPRARTLDRWLVAHLWAARLEALYDEFEASLPEPSAQDPVVRHEGPYLGQRGKFLVLLFERTSSLARWSARWGRGDEPGPEVFVDGRQGSLGFATALEFSEGELARDAAFHAQVAWEFVQILVRGLRGHRFEPSPWIRMGLGHWFARRIDERSCPLPFLSGSLSEALERPEWAPAVRGLVKHDLQPGLDELWTWEDGAPRSFTDHRMLWARLDHLLARDRAAFGRFLRACRGPVTGTGGAAPDDARRAAHERRSLEDAYGLSIGDLDEDFRTWVLATYPKR